MLLIASDIDPAVGKESRLGCACCLFFAPEELIKPLMPVFSEMFALPGTISAGSDAERVSFEAIQLSTQGAERQRKDVSWFVCRECVVL